MSTIKLKTGDDWDTWIDHVQGMAQPGDCPSVWKYIDPALGTQPEEPLEPVKPTIASCWTPATAGAVIPANVSYLLLKASDRVAYDFVYKEYSEDLKIYTKQMVVLHNIRLFTNTSVSTNNHVYLKNQNTNWARISALKKRIAPTDDALKIRLSARYAALKTFKKSTDVETWLKEWDVVYAECKHWKLSEVDENKAFWDFNTAIFAIDDGFASSQEYNLRQLEGEGIMTKTVHDGIEEFRNHYRRRVAQKGSAVGAFATLAIAENRPTGNRNSSSNSNNNNNSGNKKTTRPPPKCECGEEHWSEACQYIVPALRKEGWIGREEVFEKINKKCLEVPLKRGGLLKEHFERHFKYDGFTRTANTGKVALTMYSGLSSQASNGYKLYDAWTLDSGADIHVCNDERRSNWRKTRDSHYGDILYAGKEAYPIESFGSVTLNLKTTTGFTQIEVHDVALAPGFMANLISLDVIISKGVHWKSERPEWLYTLQGGDFAQLTKLDKHWTLEKNTVLQEQGHSALALHNSRVPRTAKFSALEMHQILGHAGVETIENVSCTDISIDFTTPSPRIIQCEACALSKAQRIISRSPLVEFSIAGQPFVRVVWDMFEMDRAYNGDRYCSHLSCAACNFTFTGSHSSKKQMEPWVGKIINLIQTQHGVSVRFFKSDGESSFGESFEEFLSSKGIIAERTAPDTPASSGSERSGGMIIIKSRTFSVASNLPTGLWPEFTRCAVYVINRTPIRKLGWKTPYEIVHKQLPTYSHMHPYGCRAYPLDKKIPKRAKMKPRAHIGYLVGYESRNIWRIWIPSQKRVIRTRDVTFDHETFWDPFESPDIVQLMSAEEAEDMLASMNAPTEFGDRPGVVVDENETESQLQKSMRGLELRSAKPILVSTPALSPLSVMTQRLAMTKPTTTPPPPPPSHLPSPKATPSPTTSISSSTNDTPIATTRANTPDNSPDEQLQSQQAAEQLRAAERASERWEIQNTVERTVEPQDDPIAPARGTGSRALGGLDRGNLITTKRSRRHALAAVMIKDHTDKLEKMEFEEFTASQNAPTTNSFYPTTNLTIVAENYGLDQCPEAWIKSFDSQRFAAFNTAFSEGLHGQPEFRHHRDTFPPPPHSHNQLRNHPHAAGFRQASDKELDALFRKGMFIHRDELEKPEDVNALPLMWVYTNKFDENGFFTMHKARLVARGDLQVSHDETYAATLAGQTFRILMALVAAFGLVVRQFDAVNAFSNAKLKSPIWLQNPPGYNLPGKFLLAIYALYGLRHSPLLWYQELSLALKDLGLHPVTESNCLFANSWLMLVFYVDDILVVYHPSNQALFDVWEQRLLSKFEFKSLGEARYFLGIRIVRDIPNKRLWLLQDDYICKLADKFNISLTTKGHSTPLPTTPLIPNPDTATPTQVTAFQKQVGSVLYPAAITRPDISKACSDLATYQLNPSPLHKAAAEHLLRYLVKTRYRAIQFDGLVDETEVFMSYSDSAFADETLTRYSSYGLSFSLFGGLIHWRAVKGSTVTTSSTEAELLALSATAKEFIRMNRLFSQLNLNIRQNPTIFCDNLQTIRLLTMATPKLQTALKHVDIHQSWLRQEVQAGNITVKWVATTEMVADGFTKLLPPQRHAIWVDQLNLVDIRHLIVL